MLLDVTYFGRNTGVMVALEAETRDVLYVKYIAHEHIADYVAAVKSIEDRGYEIKGIVVDGLPGLFKVFQSYNIQMCQFHMVAIVRRKLTKNRRCRTLTTCLWLKACTFQGFHTVLSGMETTMEAILGRTDV